MIALKEAYNAGLFKSEHLGKNISAGIVVGIVAMPLAMAFAIASGVSPAQGIYTAIFAQYIAMLVYDCGQTQYLPYLHRNICSGWSNRDKIRGICGITGVIIKKRKGEAFLI